MNTHTNKSTIKFAHIRIQEKLNEQQTFLLLLLGLLGAGLWLKSGPNGVILALTVTSNFNAKKLDPGDQDGVCLCVILQGIKTHQCGKAVVLHLLLKLLTEGPPFLSKQEETSCR